jgi:hypothetical protein
MGLLPFRITANDDLTSTVEIGGRDVSRQIQALRFDAAGREAPRLTLQLVPGAGPIEGVAEVQVATEDPKAVILDFLDQIDPDRLQSEALQGADVSAGVIVAALGVLRRWAEEAT